MSLCEDIQRRTSGFETLQDFHPLIVARVVCEWARIDREFPQQLWGHEYLGTHARIGDHLFYIAYNAQQADVFIQITVEHEPTKTQETYRLWLKDLKERGCQAGLERV